MSWVACEGQGLLAEAIRSALLGQHRATAFVGAGLVADSDPELEWEETQLKLNAIRENLLTVPEEAL